jgi:hypothetical protein
MEAYPSKCGARKNLCVLPLQRNRNLFEQAGFEYQRPKGKNHCVMRLTVPPS